MSQFSAGKGISVMDPLSSPNLGPADFWRFTKPRSMLKGMRFLDSEDVKSSVKKKIDRHSCSGF
jgi:hypothetical protein